MDLSNSRNELFLEMNPTYYSRSVCDSYIYVCIKLVLGKCASSSSLNHGNVQLNIEKLLCNKLGNCLVMRGVVSIHEI